MNNAQSNHLKVEWIEPETILKALVAEMQREGLSPTEPKVWTPGADAVNDYGDGFEPFMVVTMVVAAGWLIHRLSQTLDDHLRPGGQLVVVGNDGAVQTRVLPNVERGTLVVTNKNGTRVFKPDQRDEALGFLASMIKVAA